MMLRQPDAGPGRRGSGRSALSWLSLAPISTSMLNTKDMAPRDASFYRYGDNDSRPFFLNADHYLLATKVLQDFADSSNRASEDPSQREGNDGSIAQGPNLKISEANRRLPVDGHFSFYSDLLGFTREVSNGGMDSLPDYYGGAFVAAARNAKVKVYLLSDSCFAFASVDDTTDFAGFISYVFSAWLSDGLTPQCSVGYGSFVERIPFSGKRPPNFFGTQITGTAIADAVEVLEAPKPAGSRILLSESAWHHWPTLQGASLVSDGQFKEVIPQRHLGHLLFDCVYYLLCLREHRPRTRPFDHYVSSCASRARAAGIDLLPIAVSLVASHCPDARLREAVDQIDRTLQQYEPVTEQSPVPSTGRIPTGGV